MNVSTPLEQEIAGLLAPLRELHEKATAEVARLEREHAEAMKTKRDIEKLLRGVDPSFPNPYAKNGHKRKSPGEGKGAHKYGPEKLEAMTEWLQSHADQLNAMNDGVGFYATEVGETFPDTPVVAQSGLSAIFKQLHEGGIIRLNRSGGLGGRKYYKVV